MSTPQTHGNSTRLVALLRPVSMAPVLFFFFLAFLDLPSTLVFSSLRPRRSSSCRSSRSCLSCDAHQHHQNRQSRNSRDANKDGRHQDSKCEDFSRSIRLQESCPASAVASSASSPTNVWKDRVATDCLEARVEHEVNIRRATLPYSPLQTHLLVLELPLLSGKQLFLLRILLLFLLRFGAFLRQLRTISPTIEAISLSSFFVAVLPC